MNDETCEDCGNNTWETECPECGKPLCHECVKKLDGLNRCQECKDKDLGRGEQYSRAVRTILHDPRANEEFSDEFWGMADEELGEVAFMQDGLLHYLPGEQAFYLTDVDADERSEDLLVPRINTFLRKLGKKPLTL